MTRACRYSSLPSSIPLLPNELRGREPAALLSPSLSAGGYRPGPGHTRERAGRAPGQGKRPRRGQRSPAGGLHRRGGREGRGRHFVGVAVFRPRPPFCGRRSPQAAAAAPPPRPGWGCLGWKTVGPCYLLLITANK